ncbi:MAG: rhomboid family intramembrane serine protease, partial [Anaerolineae bacterium]|nr:rhomboid family intramembrane serine protease [Thermoflexales bacterium]MDW8408375.1 rhomboid family intramembrane serine protease [Anaerolineae bacterium]
STHPPRSPEGLPSTRMRLPTARPLWAYIFLAINVMVFIAMELTGGSTNPLNLVRFGANFAPLVAEGEYWRLFTANFLHIGILHLGVNSYALYLLGSEVEALFGHKRFVTLYLLSGVSGAVLSFMLTQGLSAGASTSLFGTFGALAVYFYRHREMLGSFGQQRLINLGLMLAINIIIGLSPGSSIDNFGHLGGFIGGAILGWFLCPVYVVINPFEQIIGDTGHKPKPELSNGMIMDSNSLSKQSLNVALFMIGLIALTILAQMAQRG